MHARRSTKKERVRGEEITGYTKKNESMVLLRVYMLIYIFIYFLPKNVNNNSNNSNNLKRKKCVTKDERNATISS